MTAFFSKWILPRADQIGALEDSIPKESALFFLRDKYELVRFEGIPKDLMEIERGRYALVNDGQGVIRNIDGVARRSPNASDDDEFLVQLDGQTFRTVVERAGAAASP